MSCELCCRSGGVGSVKFVSLATLIASMIMILRMILRVQTLRVLFEDAKNFVANKFGKTLTNAQLRVVHVAPFAPLKEISARSNFGGVLLTATTLVREKAPDNSRSDMILSCMHGEFDKSKCKSWCVFTVCD